MLQAHQAGMAYWQRNRPHFATRKDIESLARTLGWHERENSGADRRRGPSHAIRGVNSHAHQT